MNKTIKYLLIFCGFFSIMQTANAVLFSEHDADVLYWHEEKNGQHYYYYHVFNKSNTSSIVGFKIGYNWEFGLPQLTRAGGDASFIPSKFFSPPGWSGEIEYTEDTLDYNLNWDAGSNPANDVKKGDSSYRFGVKLSNQRADHLTTNFTVIFGDSTVTTKLLAGSESEAPPPNHVLAPVYDLLLSKGIDAKFISAKTSS